MIKKNKKYKKGEVNRLALDAANMFMELVAEEMEEEEPDEERISCMLGEARTFMLLSIAESLVIIAGKGDLK